MSETLSALVDAHAAATPDGAAVVFPGARRSYAELATGAREQAGALQDAGVRPGDRVGLLSRVGAPILVETVLGIWRAGAIAVPLNARFKARELGYVTRHAGLRLLLTDSDLQPLATEAGVPAGCDVSELGRLPTAPALAADRSVPAREAMLLYTSGTTSDPKGCVYLHSGITAQGQAFAERCEVTAADRFWSPLPLFHIACWCAAFTSFTQGGTMVHVGRFDPAAALEQLAAEGATIAFPAFETVWLPVLQQPGFAEVDLSALRLVINVGVKERLRAMQAALPGAAQVGCTGSTEAGGFLSIGRAEDSLTSRVSTCGPPLSGFEVRIVEPDSGSDCAAGVPGELLYRAGSRFARYWNDPATTAARIDHDGWFHSEDLVSRGEDGALTYVGRLKDMLKVGGENVAAAEIESHLLAHPAVAMAQVVSAPDARYTEVAAAYIVLAAGTSATETEIVEHCLGQIATFKVPRYIRFVAEYPMSGTKVQKVRLREAIAAELAAAGITEAPRLVWRNQR